MAAVTVTVPDAVVVKTLPLIAAPVVPALFTVHVIVLLVAVAGSTVPVRVRVPTVPPVGKPVIPVTGTKVIIGVTVPGPTLVTPPSTVIVPLMLVTPLPPIVTSKDTDTLIEAVRVNLLPEKSLTVPLDVWVTPAVVVMVNL